MGSLKTGIQNRIHEKNLKTYEQEVCLQKNAYEAYLKKWEKQERTDGFQLQNTFLQEGEITFCKMEDCKSQAPWRNVTTPYMIFVSGNGIISKKAVSKVTAFFGEHPEADVVYCHEDVTEKENGGVSKKRSQPWFKPDWSPDTLSSFFYFGNLFAVRTAALDEQGWPGTNNYHKNLYYLVLYMTKKKPAHLLDMVLFHAFKSPQEEAIPVGASVEYEDCKKIFLGDCANRYEWKEDEYGFISPVLKNDFSKISIIIPSKDHPEVLHRCVRSVREKSTYTEYEIIVVDNGSNPENRTIYETYGKQYGYTYLYVPMDFNFSKMCNLGAKEATGDYYLFLNDDMEVLTPDWMERLMGAATLEHVGAAGAKLLYPDSDKIQHVGITNMYEGPAHKLLLEDDREAHYFWKNRGVHDMIGVTAACLLVQKEKYDSVGGFYEGLKVAYNDVDFCFALHEAGFFNVLRNDVKLYHHESLSRGNDLLDEKKKVRLRKEWETLYERKPAYYDFDPFYSRHLTGVSGEYGCCLPYENRNLSLCREVTPYQGTFPPMPVNETLIIEIDHAKRERFGMQGMSPGYLIDLHAHVRGYDSSDFTYGMFLKKEEKVYEVPAVRRFRLDVVKTLYNEEHVELSGFAVRLALDVLEPGEYEIWMEAKSVLSRMVLYNLAKETLMIEDDRKASYEKEVYEQTHPYEQWIYKNECKTTVKNKRPHINGMAVSLQDYLRQNQESSTEYKILAVSEWKRLIQEAGEKEKAFILFSSDVGVVSYHAMESVTDYFYENPDTDVVYADEDELDDADFQDKKNVNQRSTAWIKNRKNPWFKPDFSPDTLRSICYFKDFFAVRTAALIRYFQIHETNDVSLWNFLETLCLEECKENTGYRVGHLRKILYHKYKITPEQIHHKIWDDVGTDIIGSIIIPSKDHPTLLKDCLDSVKKHEGRQGYEVIVVDNGSTEDNRAEIEKLAVDYGFTYLYEKENFNFSAMCNRGAAAAKGDVLLFLNDDITIETDAWMDVLVQQAMQPGTGAVGAKLYYPGGEIIQHAGITNMTVGPAHKMGGMNDRGKSIYHGRNLADYNVLAVTAACMAVRKEVFDKIGGFATELAVAYNDVDICFSLYESGYWNVVRNDVILYHHESLSRGGDETGEKALRLLREREILYNRHPGLRGKDPFYSPHLVQERLDADFHVEYQYPHEDRNRLSVGTECSALSRWKDKVTRKLKGADIAAMWNVDAVRYVERDETETILEVEGWAQMLREPSYLFERRLYLQNTYGRAWSFSVFSKYRTDTKAVLKEQKFYELSGFVARIKMRELPKGTYTLNCVLRQVYTGEEYPLFSDKIVEIE